MRNRQIKNLTLSAMFLALGIVLPFLTGQIPAIGSMMLPMHIPVLLCGLICGPQYGLAVGGVMPLLRNMMFQAPPMPNAISMTFELAAYGLVIGFLWSHSKWKCVRSLYRSMIISMLSGRAVWGITQTVVMGISGNSFGFSAFLSGAILTAVPGIFLQLILIPAVMVALHRAKIVSFSSKLTTETSET